ncbi:MAG TPA: kynureninase [Candidatus Limnocylindrales bacterium]|nr:kynureninase [Candidatus Limnocylindrales bacterium]
MVLHPAAVHPLDEADPLARFCDRFVVDDPSLVYLDGNSLGRLSRDALTAVTDTVTRQWGGELIRAWDHWLDLPERIGDRIAAVCLGARPGEVVVADSTTVNFYRLAVAALDARPDRRVIVTDRANFPTDRYVLEGLAAARDVEIRWIETDPVEGVRSADVAAAIAAGPPADVALVTLSAVDYRSAAIAEIGPITALAHDAGALTLWDLSHAVGSMPLDLEGDRVDLAVGCTYKYLNGGPGAPAFLYVRRSLQDELRNPVQGWFGQYDQFEMGPTYEPAAGIRRWLGGTPPIVGLAAVAAGVELVAEAGIDAIRAKAVALTTHAVERFDAWLAPHGFALGSPRDPARRGAHITVRHPEARGLTARLIAAGVVPDFRAPDGIRLGVSPLTTRFADVDAGIDRLRRLVAEGGS